MHGYHVESSGAAGQRGRGELIGKKLSLILAPIDYYRGAQGVVLVYDITNRPSFQHVTKWIRDVKEYADEGVNVVLVGNKCDLETDRQVSKLVLFILSHSKMMPSKYSKPLIVRAEGREIAEKNQVGFLPTYGSMCYTNE
eukprot:1356496-Amorphochlora_amoeboformis.AAC.1